MFSGAAAKLAIDSPHIPSLRGSSVIREPFQDDLWKIPTLLGIQEEKSEQITSLAVAGARI